MTDALIGAGATFGRGDGASPEGFTSIAEVTSIGGPALGLGSVEATHLTSPNKWKEYIPGMLEGGEVTLELNFLPGNATQSDTSGGLLNDMRTRAINNYQIAFPDSPSTQWIVPAFVTAFEPTTPVGDEKLAASVTLKVSGEPTLA